MSSTHDPEAVADQSPVGPKKEAETDKTKIVLVAIGCTLIGAIICLAVILLIVLVRRRRKRRILLMYQQEQEASRKAGHSGKKSHVVREFKLGAEGKDKKKPDGADKVMSMAATTTTASDTRPPSALALGISKHPSTKTAPAVTAKIALPTQIMLTARGTDSKEKKATDSKGTKAAVTTKKNLNTASKPGLAPPPARPKFFPATATTITRKDGKSVSAMPMTTFDDKRSKTRPTTVHDPTTADDTTDDGKSKESKMSRRKTHGPETASVLPETSAEKGK